MRVQAHIVASAALGGALYILFRSLPMSISAFLSGVLVDLDHVLEGYISFGRKFNIWHTIKIAETCGFKKLYLFLHSYELLLLLSVLAAIFSANGILPGICLGLVLHMVLDSSFNELYPNGMFFVKRWSVKFDSSRIVNAEQLQEKRRRLKFL